MSPTLLDEMEIVDQWLPVWSWTSMPQYNCSRVLPIGDEWTMTRGVPRPFFGFWSIVWGITCEILYMPCTIALYMERRQSCYRIMMWLAIVDIIALLSNSICFGFILIEGSVFCSRPWFTWMVGCIGLGMWCGACIGCLLLVTYRLFELMNMSFRFEAHTNFLIALATCYALYFAFFTPPVLTNSEFNAMFYDPFIGDISTEVYVNWPHTLNNLLIVMASVLLYILLCAVLFTKHGAMSSEAGRARMNVNGPIFFQASLICIFNIAASLGYIYMNFFPTPQYLVELGHVSWQLAHGVPPFIYLILNKTVKRNCRTLFVRDQNIRKSSNKNTVTFPVYWNPASPKKF